MVATDMLYTNTALTCMIARKVKSILADPGAREQDWQHAAAATDGAV